MPSTATKGRSYATLRGTGPLPTSFGAPNPQNRPPQSTYIAKKGESDRKAALFYVNQKRAFDVRYACGPRGLERNTLNRVFMQA